MLEADKGRRFFQAANRCGIEAHTMAGIDLYT